MKPPPRPRKPRRLVADKADTVFSRGGEITPPSENKKFSQDSVPTAAIPAEEVEIEAESSAAASSAAVDAASARKIATAAKRASAVTKQFSKQTKYFSEKAVAAWQKEKPLKKIMVFGARSYRRKDPEVESPDIVSLTERRKERKANQRRLYLRRFGIGAGILVCLVFLLWLLFFSPLWRLSPQKVEIDGVEKDSLIKVEEVKKIVANHAGAPLLLIGRSGLEDDLEGLPEIKDAILEPSWKGNLRIKLVSEKPVFCLVEGNACRALASNAQTLELPPNALEKLPRLAALPKEVEKTEAVQVALQALGDLGNLAGHIKTIEITVGYQFSFTLDDGRRIIWGTARDGKLKAQILQMLLKENKKLFDVSIPKSPVAQ